MNLFLDTNVWLRYFTGDAEKQLETVKNILQLANQGNLHLATSTFVLSEFIFVEMSVYKIQKKSVIEDLEAIHQLRGIWIVAKTEFSSSFALFRTNQTSLKWSDCVIASQIPKDYKLCSFDKRLEKLIGKERFIYPDQVHP